MPELCKKSCGREDTHWGHTPAQCQPRDAGLGGQRPEFRPSLSDPERGSSPAVPLVALLGTLDKVLYFLSLSFPICPVRWARPHAECKPSTLSPHPRLLGGTSLPWRGAGEKLRLREAVACPRLSGLSVVEWDLNLGLSVLLPLRPMALQAPHHDLLQEGTGEAQALADR